MEWSEYVVTRARLLAKCRTDDEANRVIEQVEDEIRRSKLTEVQKKRLWHELCEQYEKEPKPFIKESISGQKLNQLQTAVQQFLQGKGGN